MPLINALLYKTSLLSVHFTTIILVISSSAPEPTPAIPLPLSACAAITPATSVPCSEVYVFDNSFNLGYPSILISTLLDFTYMFFKSG